MLYSSTPRSIPKRNPGIFVPGDMAKDVCSSIVHKSKKLGKQNKGLGEIYILAYLHNAVLLHNSKKKLPAATQEGMGES